MAFPILSVIVFTPIIAGMIILMMPGERKTEIRMVALAAAAFDLILSVWLYFAYDITAAGYQFQEMHSWLPSFGIGYHLGVDGISTPLILLTGVVMFTGVIVSQSISDRPREFFAFLFILATGVFGVFASLDLFLLFFFYEIAVFPMYLLISIWGWVKTREYAAMKLTLYLFIGSVIALIGALAMYWASGAHSFDLLVLEKAHFSTAFQNTWFMPVFMGFAILGAIFPFHNWSPDGHVAAPTAVSMFHAGVLMKLGAFAALRVGIMLMPQGAIYWKWVILGLAAVNIVYGAFIAMVQTDLKYVIGFSSVSHMGLVMIGFATLTRSGLIGSTVQMFSHGIMTALFFASVGMIYNQTHTREISRLGGFVKIMPFTAIAFIIGALVSMGMPGFSGFVAEFPIFMGLWQTAPIIAILSVISIIVTAAYMLLVIRRVFFGEMPEEFAGRMNDVSVMDKVALGLISILMVGIGLFPSLMVPMVSSGVDHILALLG
ncbi:MAG: NADH-quinone oxidoreductase subunit M [Chloroflexi bacterium]|nr:MAG: NADH-quinone oxidoreductase subunit M [Chloroflexota bacterium]